MILNEPKLNLSRITESRGRARIGIVVPFSNTNLEPDMTLLRPRGVSLHYARAGGYDLDAVPDSDQMRQFALASLTEVMESLNAARPDVVLYGCTSATLAHGPTFDRQFAGQISEMSDTPAFTAAGALVMALQALGVQRLAYSSPYVAQLNQEAVDFLTECGFAVVSRQDVDEDLGNYGQGELSPERVYDLAVAADSPTAEAIVLSCTDMRAVEVIEVLEQDLGKPVVTSNQALIYASAKALELEKDELVCRGRLFDTI